MHSKTERISREAHFWVLMAQGSTLIAACNAVGVDRRTGRRWRQATGGLIPWKKPGPSGRYLSLDERLRIADLRLAGGSARSIAVDMKRSASTISRELRRNGPLRSGRGSGRYAPHAAQKKPSSLAAGQRAESPTTWNWPRWCRPSYALRGVRCRSATTSPQCSRTGPRCESVPKRSTGRCMRGGADICVLSCINI